MTDTNTGGPRTVSQIAYESIRAGAPGLSDATCKVIAASIARKLRAHASQQAVPTNEQVAALSKHLRESCGLTTTAGVLTEAVRLVNLAAPTSQQAWTEGDEAYRLRGIIDTATHAVLPLACDTTGTGIRERAAMQVEIADRIFAALAPKSGEGNGDTSEKVNV